MAAALPRIWPDAIVLSSPKKYFASQLDAERGVTQLAAIESVHVAFVGPVRLRGTENRHRVWSAASARVTKFAISAPQLGVAAKREAVPFHRRGGEARTQPFGESMRLRAITPAQQNDEFLAAQPAEHGIAVFGLSACRICAVCIGGRPCRNSNPAAMRRGQAPIPLAGPSRSSRAISEACKLAGTAGLGRE